MNRHKVKFLIAVERIFVNYTSYAYAWTWIYCYIYNTNVIDTLPVLLSIILYRVIRPSVDNV